MLDQDDWAGIWQNYSNYINQLNKDQYAHDRNYSDVWKERIIPFIRKIQDQRPWSSMAWMMTMSRPSTLNYVRCPQESRTRCQALSSPRRSRLPSRHVTGYGITANGQDFYDPAQYLADPLPLRGGQSSKLASGPSSKQLWSKQVDQLVITGRAVNVSSWMQTRKRLEEDHF